MTNVFRDLFAFLHRGIDESREEEAGNQSVTGGGWKWTPLAITPEEVQIVQQCGREWFRSRDDGES